jgi:exosortase
MSQLSHDHDALLHESPLDPQAAKVTWIVFGVLLALVALAYGNTIAYTSNHWSKGLYSHGWIVPLFAGYLLWARRQPLLEVSDRDRWLGVGLIGLFLLIRLVSSYYDYNNPERLSMIGVLMGVCLLVGGVWMLRWAGPALAFLVFMFPLPAVVENSLLIKLQSYATMASTFILQMFGISAWRQGNVISIDGTIPLTVAEACSGLRMLTIFGAMCVAMFMLSRRPWWDRLTILVSAIPIAMASNVIRIVATGLLYHYFPSSQTEGLLHKLIHDGAGYAMMFIGMGLLWLEMAILARITVPEDEDGYLPAGALG